MSSAPISTIDLAMGFESHIADMKGRLSSPDGSTRTDDVTVVVVTHNSARHLAALGDTLTGSSRVPSRVLVVDNASTDDTVERAREVGFDVLEAGVNDGFGAGCNLGLRAADTEFVLFCNPDARPSHDALERLLAAVAAVPAAAIVGTALGENPQARRFSRLSSSIVGFLPTRLQRPLRRFSQNVEIEPGEEPIVVDYTEGAFILCRVSALRSVNGFDERFFLYCEEEDLSRRLHERGWQTLLVPSAAVAHEGSTSSEGVDKATMTPFRIHSLYLYYRRYHSRPYAELARSAIAMCVTLDRCYRAVARRPQVYRRRTAGAPFRSITSIRRDYEHSRVEM
jgi:N-acetylglucosaminyl-diphospho-decaprenol L-rhamnosyltransferase